MIKKVWNDPVWSKVIATAIVAVVGVVASFAWGWWPPIGRTIAQAYDYLGSSTEVSNWLILVLALLALFAVAFISVLVWIRFAPTTADAPTWKDYTKDEFFGLKWRWRYRADDTIGDICTFCPICDFQVFPRPARPYPNNQGSSITYDCDGCGEHLADVAEDPNALENKVERSIQQKIRAGTWASEPDSSSTH